MYYSAELGVFEYKWKMKYYSDNKIEMDNPTFMYRFYLFRRRCRMIKKGSMYKWNLIPP